MLYQQTAILLIPFLGTSLGSAMVFFTKNKINEKFQKFLLGFASGVMIAASVWSLIIPSVEMDTGCLVHHQRSVPLQGAP